MLYATDNTLKPQPQYTAFIHEELLVNTVAKSYVIIETWTS